MKQWSFADAEYAVKRKQTRREKFLQDMDRAVPWKMLADLIEPHYPSRSCKTPRTRMTT